jgi:hypothetical protein
VCSFFSPVEGKRRGGGASFIVEGGGRWRHVATVASFDVAEVGNQARAHAACWLDLSGRAFEADYAKSPSGFGSRVYA